MALSDEGVEMAETRAAQTSEECNDAEALSRQQADSADIVDERPEAPAERIVKPPSMITMWGALALFIVCTVSACMYLCWPGVQHESGLKSNSAQTYETADLRKTASAAGASASAAAVLPSGNVAAKSGVPGDPVASSFWASLFAPQRLDNAFQSVYVALLTGLAFLVHALDRSKAESIGQYAKDSWVSRVYVRLREWKVVLGLFFMPTIIYFGAMIWHGRDDAAVYLMAIVAIYVAAQHYVALRHQEETVGEIKGHTAKLKGIRQTLTGQVDALKKQVESVKNALGTEYSQSKLYEYYRVPSVQVVSNASDFVNTGIYAVYRMLDIDEQWMQEEEEDCWDAYCDPLRKDTLYASLLLGYRTRVLIVTDMQIRVDQKDDTPSGIKDRVLHFEKFVGLMWHTVVLRKAAQALARRGIFADYEIRIGESSNWMHVVDDRVFQLFGKIPTNIYSRNLTEDTSRVDDSFAGENLVKWAMEDIQRVALRGMDSVDYLCAAISHAMMYPYFRFSEGTFQDILDSLDFALWFKRLMKSISILPGRARTAT
jgi:hypothetical protein